MAVVTIHSNFGAQENTVYFVEGFHDFCFTTLHWHRGSSDDRQSPANTAKTGTLSHRVSPDGGTRCYRGVLLPPDRLIKRPRLTVSEYTQ